jgi:hypothetical protein
MSQASQVFHLARLPSSASKSQMMFVDAIKIVVDDSNSSHCTAPTTLIRLYEFLKNTSIISD